MKKAIILILLVQLTSPVLCQDNGEWTNVVGIIIDETTITKENPDGWDNGGASSENILFGGSNGYVDLTITDIIYNKAFGLVSTFTSVDYKTFDYSFYISGNKVYIFSFGELIGQFGKVNLNDQLRIEAVGNIVNFLKNGRILYGLENAGQSSFVIGLSIYEEGASISNLYSNFNYDETLEINTVNETPFDPGSIHISSLENRVPPYEIEIIKIFAPVAVNENPMFITDDYEINCNAIKTGKYQLNLTDAEGAYFNFDFLVGMEAGWYQTSGLIQDYTNIPKIAYPDKTVYFGQGINIRKNNEDGWENGKMISYNFFDLKSYGAVDFVIPDQIFEGAVGFISDALELSAAYDEIKFGFYLIDGHVSILTPESVITDVIDQYDAGDRFSIELIYDIESGRPYALYSINGETKFSYEIPDEEIEKESIYLLEASIYNNGGKINNLLLIGWPYQPCISYDITNPTINEPESGIIDARVYSSAMFRDFTFLWTDDFTNELGETEHLENLAAGTYHLNFGYSTPDNVTHDFENDVTQQEIDNTRTLSCASNDENKNWIYNTVYDLNGVTITGESKVFADAFGREIQSQSKLLTENKVLISQTIYDADGRKALATLPAPVDQQDLCYYDNFIKDPTGGNYTYADFDLPNTSGSPNSGEKDNPKPVSGDLGNYYSNTNNWEPFVAASAFPYSRVEFDDLNSGRLRKASSAGEDLRMGSGHETQTYSMPAAGELYYVFGYAQGWYTGNISTTGPFNPGILVQYKVFKNINKDENGKESVEFYDMDGKLVATCLSGSVNEQNVMEQFVKVVGNSSINYVDVHLPAGCETSLTFNDNGYFMDVDIMNLVTGQVIHSNVTVQNFPSLSSGYYRFIFKDPNYWNQCSFSYELNYYNWTLYYYDKAGRLAGMVSPEGVDQYVSMLNTYSRKYASKDIEDFIPYPYWKDGDSDQPATHPWEKFFDPAIQNDPGNTLLNFYDGIITTEFDDRQYISLDLPAVSAPQPNQVRYTTILVSSVEKTVVMPSDETSQNRTAGSNYFLGSCLPEGIEGAEFGSYQNNSPGSTFKDVETCNHYQYQCQVNYSLVYYDAFNTELFRQPGKIEPTYDYYKLTNNTAYSTWTFNNWWQFSSHIVPSNILTDAHHVKVYLSQLNVVKYWDENGNGNCIAGIMPEVDHFDLLAQLKMYVRAEHIIVPLTPSHTMVTSNEYNSLGWLLSETTPDAGKTEYVYMNDGRIRFSQNAKQKASHANFDMRKFSYISYDDNSRPLEVGEYNPAIAGTTTVFFENYHDFVINGSLGNPASSVHNPPLLSSSPGSALLNATCRTQSTHIQYDLPDADVYNTTGLSSADYTQNYVMGAPVKTWNSNSTTWYSFDELGRLTWTVQKIEDMNGVNGDAVKTVNYTYEQSNLKKVVFQKEDWTERLYHHYTYDADQRLKEVYTSKNGSDLTKHGAFYYYLHGPLKRIEIGKGLQAEDFVYNINGWLKSINSPDPVKLHDPGKDGTIYSHNRFASDLFGFSLDYFDGDYKRNYTYVQSNNENDPTTAVNLYNGIIKAQRWNNKVPSYWGTNNIQQSTSPLVYCYRYDNKYQLDRTTFGTITDNGTQNSGAGAGSPPVFNLLNEYKIEGLTYDLNGNIKTLTRNAYGTNPNMDQLTYSYTTGTNKLHKVADNVSAYTYTSNEVKNGQGDDNYEYNEIGELTEDHLNNKYYDYDAYGNVTAVYSDAAKTSPIVTFTYDEHGYRLSKCSYSGPIEFSTYVKTWYVNDASGNMLGLYECSSVNPAVVLKEQPFYGLGRMGIFDRNTDKYTYQLDDHLGNVRATFTAQKLLSISTGFEDTDDINYLFRNEHVSNGFDYTTGTGHALGLKNDPSNNEAEYGGDIEITVHPGDAVATQYFSHFTNAGPQVPVSMLVFHLFDKDGNYVHWDASPIGSNDNSWNQNNHTYNVPSGLQADDYLLRIYFWNTSTTDKVWFDDLTINITENTATAGTSGVDIPHKESLSDYYALGSIMPGRSFQSSLFYRFGYQGQYAERDPEINLNNFELRMYDGLLGRWMVTDPYNQFHSPYLGMGNNFTNSVDPDGGEVDVGVLFTTTGRSGFDAAASSLLTGAFTGIANYFAQEKFKMQGGFVKYQLKSLDDWASVNGGGYKYFAKPVGDIIAYSQTPVYLADVGLRLSKGENVTTEAAIFLLAHIRIGKFKINAEEFHRAIKPRLLTEVKKVFPNFEKIVGKNPDIGEEAGKIILQGNGPFKGKTLKTEFNVNDWFE